MFSTPMVTVNGVDGAPWSSVTWNSMVRSARSGCTAVELNVTERRTCSYSATVPVPVSVSAPVAAS